MPNLEKQLYAFFPKEHRHKVILIQLSNFKGVLGIRATQCGHLVLYYDPIEVQKELDLGVKLADMVEHEYLHYACGHIYDDLEELKDYSVPKIAVARHCEVNSYLPAIWDILDPTTGQPKHDFPAKYGFSDLKSPWREYYKRLPDPCGGGAITCIPLTSKEKEELEELLGQKLEELGNGDLKLIKTQPQILEKVTTNLPKGLCSQLMQAIQQSCPQYFMSFPTHSKPHKWKPIGCPGYRKRGPKVLFAIDCSGSTTGELQKTFFSQVSRLLKEFQGDVLEFDDSIKHFGKKPTFSEWGGGTNFACVQEFYKKKPYDLCVWFTDGEGDWRTETTPTKNIVVLWGNETNLPKNWKMLKL